MPPQFQVRADFDDRGIVGYQAYAPAIAAPALAAQRFLPPFSLNRMTWIKPSFLWLMHRSGWATSPVRSASWRYGSPMPAGRRHWPPRRGRMTSSSVTPAKSPRRSAWRSTIEKNTSTRFSQEADVG